MGDQDPGGSCPSKIKSWLLSWFPSWSQFSDQESIRGRWALLREEGPWATTGVHGSNAPVLSVKVTDLSIFTVGKEDAQTCRRLLDTGFELKMIPETE